MHLCRQVKEGKVMVVIRPFVRDKEVDMLRQPETPLFAMNYVSIMVIALTLQHNADVVGLCVSRDKCHAK